MTRTSYNVCIEQYALCKIQTSAVVESFTMSASPCYLFKNSFVHKKASDENIAALPDKVRGIYILFKEDKECMNAVYVGITRGKAIGVKSRLRSHLVKKTKGSWTHFSFFEVWDNIPKEQVEELEGLFLNIFGKDRNGLGLNKVKTNTKLSSIARKGNADWLATSPKAS